MNDTRWMIYGAYGYTGALVVEEAVRRGHRPIVAGRARDKLDPIAARFGLPAAVVDLADSEGLARALEGVSLVFHAAGPFRRTSAPMVRACLAAGTSYVDITGEIPVFHDVLAQDEAARRRGVALIPGVGFDVVPTDCLARFVADRVPGARELELAIAGFEGPSPGTAKTMLESLPYGSFARRDGVLVPQRLGAGGRTIHFGHRALWALPIPWGDLETAFHTTGIGNITTFMAYPPRVARVIELAAPALARAMSWPPLLRLAQRGIERAVTGPSAEARQRSRSFVWARAAAADGREAQAWLETAESYRFTAEAGVRAVERILQDRPIGATTPARAFGADFVLEIPSTTRNEQRGQDHGS